jgi:hypothetical protein
MIQVRCKEVGQHTCVISFSSLFVFVRSDEEVTHNIGFHMICDVHFGDTRNDITPAIDKWLPNDHTEERYATNKTTKMGTNSRQTTRILTRTFPFFSLPSTTMQVRCKEWVGVITFSSLFVFVRSDEERTHIVLYHMICDVHFGDTRYDLTPAICKWLPNDHPEEQHTSNKYSRII